MTGDPKECREHAKCWLELVSDPIARSQKCDLRGWPDSWLRLAKNDLEHAEALLEHWGDPGAAKDRLGVGFVRRPFFSSKSERAPGWRGCPAP